MTFFFRVIIFCALLSIAFWPLKAAASCPGYSVSTATISPCTAAPQTTVRVTMRRAGVIPQSVSFLTGVRNGIAVGGIVPVTGSPGNYVFVVPAFLCTAGSGNTYAVRLADANGVNQGEIGRLTVDCRGAVGVARARGGSNLIVNGSLENGPNPDGFVTLARGSRAIPGWTVLGTSVDYIGSYWVAASGARSLDLDGTPGPGGVAQTFATVPGARYYVSFALAGNPACAPTVKRLQVSAGNRTAYYSFNVTGHSTSSMGWVRRTFSFTAIGPQTRLVFMSLDPPGNCGPALDDVVVSRR